MLDYGSPDTEPVGSDVMLRLTTYFFGGFVAAMACFACIAFLTLRDGAVGKTIWSIGSAFCALLTAHCAHHAWRILQVDTRPHRPMDARLDD